MSAKEKPTENATDVATRERSGSIDFYASLARGVGELPSPRKEVSPKKENAPAPPGALCRTSLIQDSAGALCLLQSWRLADLQVKQPYIEALQFSHWYGLVHRRPG